MSGFYADNWWKIQDTPCTVEEIEWALQYSIATDTVNIRRDNEKTISGMVSGLK